MPEPESPFRHLGGSIIADHGPLTLKVANALVSFYRTEQALSCGSGARLCRQRAENLEFARAQAILWRRAAGWTDPADADATHSCQRNER